VGVWQNDRVEIIANDQGNRTTPSYVAFTDTERLIGDAAKNQVAMNPRNTVSTSMLQQRQALMGATCACLAIHNAASCSAPV
jgi:molecular chaperone DnaK (HSP70)